MIPLMPLILALIAGCFGVPSPAVAEDEMDLIKLLSSRQCQDCQLSDVDLTHADLRDADLEAQLQRANLSQARLDGDLSGGDLSFASLQGATLRGSDLRNIGSSAPTQNGPDWGTTGSKGLDQSHWDGARGQQGARSHSGLHNAGVDAALAGRWREAEQPSMLRSSQTK